VSDLSDLIFDEPEGPSKIYPKDVVNHVLMVWATDYIPHSPTQFNDGSDPKKPCDVVVVDVIDLDQVDETTGALGLVSRGSWWRQGRLIQRFKGRVGRPNPLIGRMTKGLGPNGAFDWLDLSSDEKALARARTWWATNGGFAPSAPFDRPAAAPPQEVKIAQQTVPVPEPSPLEEAARAAIGRPASTSEDEVLARLRRLSSGNEEEAPF
jgi:hypothetical protein